MTVSHKTNVLNKEDWKRKVRSPQAVASVLHTCTTISFLMQHNLTNVPVTGKEPMCPTTAELSGLLSELHQVLLLTVANSV